MEERECLFCGDIMYAERKTKRYCSASCKTNYNRQKGNKNKFVTTPEKSQEVFYPELIKNINSDKISDLPIENFKANVEVINNNQMSELEARQIRFNGSFIRELNSLLNYNSSKVKVKHLKSLINILITLREDYIEDHDSEYAQHPFLEDFELLLSDLITFYKLNVKKKTKNIFLNFDDNFLSKNKLLIQKLIYYNIDLRDKYL